MSRELEKNLQRKVVAAARKGGWIALKQAPTATVGYPDYMFLRKGVVRFIEFKTSTGAATPLQVERWLELEGEGFAVLCTYNEYEAKKFLDLPV